MTTRQTSPRQEAFAASLAKRFGDAILRVSSRCGERGYEVAPGKLLAVGCALRDDFGFEMLVDVCGVDYLTYGQDEWETHDATSGGFSRAGSSASNTAA